MDQEFQIDLDEARRTIERTEVIGLFFPIFRQTLLLDTRRGDVDAPMARVVPMVQSADERLRHLRQMRPRLGRPRSMALIPWPRRVASVKTTGIWQMIVDRLLAAGLADAEVTLERCYRELLRTEQTEFRNAVSGEGYRTVWSRSKV